MQRGEGAVLLFVGIMLIYLSVYGLSGFPTSLQSYETYTKVDPNNHISYSAGVITQQVSRAESAYMYFNRSAGYFSSSFTHKLQFEVTAAVQWSSGDVWMVSNNIGDSDQLRNTDFVEVLWLATDPTTLRLYFRCGPWTVTSDASNPYDSKYVDGLSVGTPYYLTVTRTGQTMTCQVYSDSSQTSPVQTMSINLSPDATSFEYIYACSTCRDEGSNQANAYPGTQVIQGLDLSDNNNGGSLAVSVSPSSASLTAGQQQTFTATASGGASPYTYQWYVDGSSVSGATSSSYTYTATSGSHSVYCTVKDSASATATSSTANINGGGNDGQQFPNILQWLQDLLSNSTVQSLMFIAGLMMSGVGCIVLLLPTKHVSSPA